MKENIETYIVCTSWLYQSVNSSL